MIHSVGTPLLWISFSVFIVVMLVLDLVWFQRKPHEIRMREAVGWVVFWIFLAFLFNIFVYYRFGPKLGLEFTAGFLIEKALSVDNLFVFIVVLSYFAVPSRLQHRVIFWGVLGALIMRAIFVFLGALLLQRFEWIVYIFGAFLVYTGAKTFFENEEEKIQPEKNPVLKLMRRILPITKDFRESSFFVREHGKLHATPLFLVLVVIEVTDVVFAVDSVPAVFAVSQDPFIVYTSNIFAILGLRALFFVISKAMRELEYLKYGLGFILAFVGFKMLISHYYKLPVILSLGIIVSALLITVMVSLLAKKK